MRACPAVGAIFDIVAAIDGLRVRGERFLAEIHGAAAGPSVCSGLPLRAWAGQRGARDALLRPVEADLHFYLQFAGISLFPQ